MNDEASVSFIPMNLILDSYANKHTSEIRKWKEIKKGFTHFREGDVGIAKITPCFENRKSVVFQHLESGYGAGTTELHVLRPISELFLSNYLIWFVKTEDFITNGVNCFTGAVGQQRVGKNDIEETYFPLPPLSEQRRIVSVVESAFALIDEIETNKISLTQLIKQAKSKILDLAIRGKLVPQDPNDEPEGVLLEKIKNEQKTKKTTVDNLHYPFDVPKGWVWCKLEEICEQITDGTHRTPNYKENGIPFLRVTDITESNESKKFISQEEHNELIKRCNPEKGDVLLSKNGTIGVAKVVDWDYDFSIFVSLCLLKPKKIISNKYLTFYLNSDDALKQMQSRGKTVTITNLHLEEVRQLEIPLPTIAEQHRIVQKIETIFQTLDSIQNNL